MNLSFFIFFLYFDCLKLLLIIFRLFISLIGEFNSSLIFNFDSARGCDVALRPRGRATAGPRGAQVALTRVAGGQADGSTWAPVWGATWQEGSQVEGHGYSGPW